MTYIFYIIYIYTLSLTTRNVKKILCIGTFKSSVLHCKRTGVRQQYYNGVTRHLLLFARAVDDDHVSLEKARVFEVGKRKKKKWLIISVRNIYIYIRTFFIIIWTDDVLIRRCIVYVYAVRRRGFRTTSWPI